jgi:hypothetical protein
MGAFLAFFFLFLWIPTVFLAAFFVYRSGRSRGWFDWNETAISAFLAGLLFRISGQSIFGISDVLFCPESRTIKFPSTLQSLWQGTLQGLPFAAASTVAALLCRKILRTSGMLRSSAGGVSGSEATS